MLRPSKPQALETSEPPPYHPSMNDTSTGRPAFKPGFRVPRKTATVGMLLFLAALAMLFISSLLGYALIRLRATAPPAGAFPIPWPLWLSTCIMIASSVAMHRALRSVQLERQPQFRANLLATLILALLFVAVQTPCMLNLYREHQAAAASSGLGTFGLMLFLILVHALHVVGGIIPLVVVAHHAFTDRYDHEHYEPVRQTAMYWHFLDAVWLVMFAVLAVLR